MANEMNGEYGFNHWAVQKAPERFISDRAIGKFTIGDYSFKSEEVPMSDEYSYTKFYAVNNRTGAILNTSQELINDVNANAAYINNTFPSVKSQFDSAIHNLNNAKAEYSNLTGKFNNAKNTLDEYKTQLGDVRNQYNTALEQFNQNYKAYEATLQNFVSAEAQNAQKIENLINDVPQVISSYEADYGRKPTEQELASLITGGNGDIAKGYVSFDANNVSEKEAKAFLGELGYNPSDSEIKQFAGQINEDAARANIAGYVNPRQTTFAEAKSFLEANGYSPNDAEIRQFIGQVDENVAKQNIANYVNPRQVTIAEAREFLEVNGYVPTKEELEQFTGQKDEAATKAEADKYIKPKVEKIQNVINLLNQGKLSPEQVEDELKAFGFQPQQVSSLFAANADAIDRSRKAQDIVIDYADIGSDLSREGAIQRLVKEAGITEDVANNYLGRVDAQVNARNDLANKAREFLSGSVTEDQLKDAMDAAGISGQAKTDQLTYYRAGANRSA